MKGTRRSASEDERNILPLHWRQVVNVPVEWNESTMRTKWLQLFIALHMRLPYISMHGCVHG
jgi:hypothetical protein